MCTIKHCRDGEANACDDSLLFGKNDHGRRKQHRHTAFDCELRVSGRLAKSREGGCEVALVQKGCKTSRAVARA